MSRGRDLEEREVPDIREYEAPRIIEREYIVYQGRAEEQGNAPEYTPDPRDEIGTRSHRHETLEEIGKFRAIPLEDLERYRFKGDSEQMNHDLRNFSKDGLIRRHTAVTPRGEKLRVVTLTEAGKSRVERKLPPGQRVYADLKRAEIFHDAAIYRMYQAESERIRAAGGRVKRVVLECELVKTVYSELHLARETLPEDYRLSQEEVAREHGLKVIDGKIPFPDLRIEYETRDQQMEKVDLELATGNYRRFQLIEKARAGFHVYIPPKSLPL